MLTLKSSFFVEKGIQTVWNFLNKVEDLAFCMPTCKKLDIIDEKTVDTVLQINLGRLPIQSEARFTITETVPPSKLVATGLIFFGRSMGGFWKMLDREAEAEVRIVLDLSPVGEGKTCLDYLIEIKADGRLRKIYDAVIKAKGEEIERTFVKNVNDKISGRSGI